MLPPAIRYHFNGSLSRLETTHMPHDKPFDDPKRVVLSRIYTRGGDEGQTSLVGGQRVAKDTLRIEAYGTVDELNAFVGLARTLVEETARRHRELGAFATTLRRIQHELFNLGSILATLPADVHPKQPQITRAEIDRLEQEIDLANQSLPVLRSFVLPGGSRLDADLHVCRTVCRRAERLVVRLARESSTSESSVPVDAIRYLNRLSDAFFVWSRWVNAELGYQEALWEPNAAASGDKT
jgi:cob(I)alamin adenosyltransferase